MLLVALAPRSRSILQCSVTASRLSRFIVPQQPFFHANMSSKITNWASEDGEFRRKQSVFRDTIATSSDKNAQFPAAKGRYHLVASLACPWAHRAMIVRVLKGLEDIISLSIVHPHMGEKGWSFNGAQYEGQGAPASGEIGNIIQNPYKHDFLRDLYFLAQKDYDGRFTVPVLWDLEKKTIVNNESSEIIRMFNTQFDELVEDEYKGLTFYPDELKKDIDELNEWVYDTVNNGVYKSGFATAQKAYIGNVTKLFESLDRLEKILEAKDYLVGDKLTEADIRLFTTIIRFDPVYVGHFKCNLGTIRHNYPNINRWCKQLYWNNNAFKDTTDFNHIKIHYYTSHPQINPTRIVPAGPDPAIEPL